MVFFRMKANSSDCSYRREPSEPAHERRSCLFHLFAFLRLSSFRGVISVYRKVGLTCFLNILSVFLWWRHLIEESTFSHLFTHSVYVFTVLNCSVRFFVFRISLLDCARFVGPTPWSFYCSGVGTERTEETSESVKTKTKNVFGYTFASVSISRPELSYFLVGLTARMNERVISCASFVGILSLKATKLATNVAVEVSNSISR